MRRNVSFIDFELRMKIHFKDVPLTNHLSL